MPVLRLNLLNFQIGILVVIYEYDFNINVTMRIWNQQIHLAVLKECNIIINNPSKFFHHFELWQQGVVTMNDNIFSGKYCSYMYVHVGKKNKIKIHLRLKSGDAWKKNTWFGFFGGWGLWTMRIPPNITCIKGKVHHPAYQVSIDLCWQTLQLDTTRHIQSC
jgi:hypothetical protein